MNTSPTHTNQHESDDDQGRNDGTSVETTLLLSRPMDTLSHADDDLLFNGNLSSNPSSSSSRRRLWPDIRHYDTIDMTHLIVNSGDLSQPTAANVYDPYSYSPTLNEYHDFISHNRLSFNHDRDDTLLILGSAETSLLDLEDGRRQQVLGSNSTSMEGQSNGNSQGGALPPISVSSHGLDASISQNPTNTTTNNTTTTPNNTANTDNGTTGEDGQTDYVMDTVNRLRCIFSCVTLPIVPIGSVLSMTLFYVIYAAFVLDVHQTCSHPLKLYTLYSTALFIYIPQHKTIKNILFRYNRERDGPHAPMGVKVYDQLFYLLCLIYLSGGIDLVQGCMEDLVKTESTSSSSSTNPLSLTSSDGDFHNKTQAGISTCAVTCPHLYAATKVYVTILQLFAFAMLLPIVFLPCIYAYIIRRVHRGVESILLQSILRRGAGGDAFRSNTEDGVTVQEIMDTLQQVQLVFVDDSNAKGVNPLAKKVQIIYNSNSSKNPTANSKNRGKITDWEDVKDCCICMSDLVVSDELQPCVTNEFTFMDSSNNTKLDTSSSTMLSPLLSALEDDEFKSQSEEVQQQRGNTPRGAVSDDTIVQTKCGHLFHQVCLGGWIGGSWEDPHNAATGTGTQDRPARRRCCPLCREDLAPPSHPQQ